MIIRSVLKLPNSVTKFPNNERRVENTTSSGGDWECRETVSFVFDVTVALIAHANLIQITLVFGKFMFSFWPNYQNKNS